MRLERAQLVSNEFIDCKFQRCSLVESVLRDCRFIDCVFLGCDLSLVQAPNSVFSAVRFEDSKILGVNWTLANWSAPRLGEPMVFSRCAISHSTFIGLHLQGIQIKDCVAANVDFREADLSQADFSGTDLSDSLFGNTNLEEADLSGARDYHIDPGKNTLRGARFSLPEALALLYHMDIVLVDEEHREETNK
jgi:uncharacterized protein YjbI with pentapeptide repeats